jgi:hypothetical protein
MGSGAKKLSLFVIVFGHHRKTSLYSAKGHDIAPSANERRARTAALGERAITGIPASRRVMSFRVIAAER